MNNKLLLGLFSMLIVCLIRIWFTRKFYLYRKELIAADPVANPMSLPPKLGLLNIYLIIGGFNLFLTTPILLFSFLKIEDKARFLYLHQSLLVNIYFIPILTLISCFFVAILLIKRSEHFILVECVYTLLVTLLQIGNNLKYILFLYTPTTLSPVDILSTVAPIAVTLAMFYYYFHSKTMRDIILYNKSKTGRK